MIKKAKGNFPNLDDKFLKVYKEQLVNIHDQNFSTGVLLEGLIDEINAEYDVKNDADEENLEAEKEYNNLQQFIQ